MWTSLIGVRLVPLITTTNSIFTYSHNTTVFHLLNRGVSGLLPFFFFFALFPDFLKILFGILDFLSIHTLTFHFKTFSQHRKPSAQFCGTIEFDLFV